MVRKAKLLGVALVALACSGCIGRGGNIRGNFTCRAPQGTCAPTRVIDAGAGHKLDIIDAGEPDLATARTRSGVAAGDIARTAERTLRIVFPAHVDAAGTLHDEAVAWAVVENPHWTAELRRDAKGRGSVVATLRSRSKAGAVPMDSASIADLDAAPPEDAAAVPDITPFSPSLASPLVLPSTAAEAVAGASAPVVEGFDLAPPDQHRTPRPFVAPERTYPTPEAIAAAHAKGTKPHDAAPVDPAAPEPVAEGQR